MIRRTLGQRIVGSDAHRDYEAGKAAAFMEIARGVGESVRHLGEVMPLAKRAQGSPSSCLACGHIDTPGAWVQDSVPLVYVCLSCRDAGQAARQAKQQEAKPPSAAPAPREKGAL